MEEKHVIIIRLINSIEEMLDIFEERETEDEEFAIPREIAESLREELNEMLWNY